MNELVPGYEATGWYGLCVPMSRPAEIVNALNTATNAALASLGVEPMINTPAGFGKFIAQESEKWGKVIKSAGIKPE